MKQTWIEKPTARARRRGRLVPGLIGAALLVVAPTIALAAPTSALLDFWNVSDETNAETIDHSAWQSLLTTYLSSHPSGVSRFDYAALKANAEDAAKLVGYLAHLQAHDPRAYARAEQKAYWINFYNALTVQVVVNAYPVDSIRDIHESWIPLSGPWDDVHATVAGQELTLNNIEHGILRPIWGDNRIHYAANCASYGCPNRVYASRGLMPPPIEMEPDADADACHRAPRTTRASTPIISFIWLPPTKLLRVSIISRANRVP